jgi:hypothetical protein
MTEELESRLEKKSVKLEALIQEKFGDDFEFRIDATSDALDALVEECRDADLADGQTKVMSRTVDLGNGKNTVKIACVKGDGEALRSPTTLAVINSSKKLCDVEKKSFRDQVFPEGELDGAEQ